MVQILHAVMVYHCWKCQYILSKKLESAYAKLLLTLNSHPTPRSVEHLKEKMKITGRISIMKSPQLVASCPGPHMETGYASGAL